VISSGISMYAMALLIQTLGLFHGIIPDAYIFHVSILLSAVIVLGYIFLGGLTSAIYNEVLQFFLIVLGFAPLVIIGLNDMGGWNGLMSRMQPEFTHSMDESSTSYRPSSTASPACSPRTEACERYTPAGHDESAHARS